MLTNNVLKNHIVFRIFNNEKKLVLKFSQIIVTDLCVF